MKIESISQSNLHLVNTIDSTFTVDSRLALKLSGNNFSYEIQPVTPYKKTYVYDQPDYAAYIDNDLRTVFFAFNNEVLTGQIIILKYWSGYAYINDISVKDEFRGKGIGNALMAKAIEWAKQNKCIGIEAETQDVNVKACLFYEKLEFTLGGVDFFRYKFSEKDKNEIALNWYLLF